MSGPDEMQEMIELLSGMLRSYRMFTRELGSGVLPLDKDWAAAFILAFVDKGWRRGTQPKPKKK